MSRTPDRLIGVLATIGALMLTGGAADAQQARLTKLTDVAFGALSSTASDVSNNQNVCAYAISLSGLYSIRASGSGTGGALTLSSGGAAMPYEVQWAASPNQSSGTALPANTTVSGFADGLVNDTCSLINTASASLIVILRTAALSGATAGSYSGTLTLVIAAQ
jgi:hypothetical protein